MTRRRKIIFAALGIALVLGLCTLLIPSGPPDPIYEGKPLSYWLKQPTTMGHQGEWLVAVPALEHVDANAIPYLVHAYASSDSPARRKYAELYPNLFSWMQAWLPKPRDTVRIRGNALLYLEDLRTFDSPLVLPAMARTLEHDKDQGFRGGAANFLGQGHSKDPAVIHALVHGLQDPDYFVRWYSTNSLRKLDPTALTNAVNKL